MPLRLSGRPPRQFSLQQGIKPQGAPGRGGVDRHQEKAEYDGRIGSEQRGAASQQEVHAEEDAAEGRQPGRAPQEKGRADGHLPEYHQMGEYPGVGDRHLVQEGLVEIIGFPSCPLDERFVKSGAAEAPVELLQAVFQEEVAGIESRRNSRERRAVVLDPTLEESDGPASR